jgi:hypothetical protein
LTFGLATTLLRRSVPHEKALFDRLLQAQKKMSAAILALLQARR